MVPMSCVDGADSTSDSVHLEDFNCNICCTLHIKVKHMCKSTHFTSARYRIDNVSKVVQLLRFSRLLGRK